VEQVGSDVVVDDDDNGDDDYDNDEFQNGNCSFCMLLLSKREDQSSTWTVISPPLTNSQYT